MGNDVIRAGGATDSRWRPGLAVVRTVAVVMALGVVAALSLLANGGTAYGADPRCDDPDFAQCSEPVAAATHYAANNTVAVGDRICIYDLGGGTFDVCIVVKTAEGSEILGTPFGVEDVGGIDFNEQIIRVVHQAISSTHLGLDQDDPGYARLRRECVDAKEALPVDVDTVIPVALAGLSTSHRLTRGELESMIDGSIESTTATRSALRSAGVSPRELAAIVLVGGSSRIPLVAEKLASLISRSGVHQPEAAVVLRRTSIAGCL